MVQIGTVVGRKRGISRKIEVKVSKHLPRDIAKLERFLRPITAVTALEELPRHLEPYKLSYNVAHNSVSQVGISAATIIMA